MLRGDKLKAFFKRSMGAAGAMVLTACATTARAPSPASSQTAALEAALQARYSGLGGKIRYFDAHADLNGDGTLETIVHVVGPMVCGSGGCNTLVLSRRSSGFVVISEITVSGPPIRIASDSANGWRNLIVRVSGGGVDQAYDAELRFDGNTYPTNPTVAPARRARDSSTAQVVIPAFDRMDEGKPLAASVPGDRPDR